MYYNYKDAVGNPKGSLLVWEILLWENPGKV